MPPVEPVTAADAAGTAGSVDPVGPGAPTGAAESSGASAATGPSGSTGPSGPGGHSGHGGEGFALDEEAAWAAIVAGYGQEPPDPPGAKPFKPIEDLLLPEPPNADGTDGAGGGEPNPARTPLGGSVSFAPGVASPGTGPRDYAPDEPSDDDFGSDDEGHFVPPEPPPLPDADATAKFAWLGVIGGPVLLLLAVLLGWDMTWWLTTLGIGGFVGGVATLVARMNPGDEDDDDPGRGAVV
ncbi:hypothetical protein [Streptomyces sp. NPDC056160]|uniref:hypothetical protein n=1 Tax=Streptomyces sp. NPDC056160 TaxID=3345731 RepID=UPI0035DFA7F9